MTVSQLSGIILDQLAGNRIQRIDLTVEERKERENAPPGFMFPVYFNDQDRQRPLNQEAVKEWWKDAKAGSEKDYLLEKILVNVTDGISTETNGVNFTVLKMLAARYPGELSEVYFKALNTEVHVETKEILVEINNAPLDQLQKRKILERGLTHQKLEHRYDAEIALATLDANEFSIRLLKRIETLPLSNENDPNKSLELKLVKMAYHSNDRQIWPALEDRKSVV